MHNYEDITAEFVQARVCKLIRRYIKERGTTYAEIAEIIDVDQRTLESWARNETAPKLFHYARLLQFFGLNFGNEFVELVGMTGLHYINTEATNGRQLLTDVLGVGGDLSKALEDGHIDPRERAEITPRLKKVATKLDAFCAEEKP